MALEIVDPHFHFWSETELFNDNIKGIYATIPSYLASNYSGDISAATGIHVVGAVHVEAIVGQKDGGFVVDPVTETRIVAREFSKLDFPAKAVTYVNLARPDAASVIAQHRLAAPGHFVGVRMILNYHNEDPSICWPQVEKDFLAPLSADFARGFEVLASEGLSFDLQANPHQLAPFAAFIAGRSGAPTPNIILNHLGSPRLGRGAEADAIVLADWRAGLAALQKIPSVFVKLSMLDFCRAEWRTDDAAREQVKSLVLEAIALFGPQRCMFASNFPVERSSGWELGQLFRSFKGIVEGLPAEDQEWLFSKTAAKAYGLPA